jgi:hypothetical protein
MRLTRLLPALAVGVLLSGAAFALDAAAPPPAPGAGAPAAAPAQPGAMKPETEIGKKAKSEDCYRQADAQDLHGKPRKKFHRECMKG